ncbi:MAG: nucleotide sugar dehydrogenase, partial [Methanobacteriota archaeon]
GAHVIAYDPNPEVTDSISRGVLRIPSPEDTLGFPVKPLVDRGLVEPTSDVTRVLRDATVKVHFIAVPTEKAGEPWGDALADVADHLAGKDTSSDPELIVIESTVAPGHSHRYILSRLENRGRRIGRDFLFAVSPRRDWFVSRERNLHTLPRVVGGFDETSLRAAMEVLSIVCKQIVPVSSYRVAELVKPLENGFRAINIAFIDEVARAFPDLDVREAVEAAATKWNFLPHYPGAGIGGYCIPIAPKYLLAGANGGSAQFQLMKSFTESLSEHTRYIADTLHRASNGGSILLLGLAYKEGVKVHEGSPALAISESLRKRGADIRIHDPLYDEREIRRITGVETAAYPDDLERFSMIAVLVAHRPYRSLAECDLARYIRPGTSVLDVEGVWEPLGPAFARNGIHYRRLGSTNWTDFS